MQSAWLLLSEYYCAGDVGATDSPGDKACVPNGAESSLPESSLDSCDEGDEAGGPKGSVASLPESTPIDKGKEVQNKWKHIRDNFRREYQAQKDVTSGQGQKKRKKYRYYDQLLFLIPYVKEAPTSGNYKRENNNTSQWTDSNHSDEENIEKLEVPAMPKTIKKRKKDKNSFEDEILKIMKADMATVDEDRTFCLSLVPSLKKMDDDTKIAAKIDILNIIRQHCGSGPQTQAYEPYISIHEEPIANPSTSNPKTSVHPSKKIKLLSQSQTHKTEIQPLEPYISINEEPISGPPTIANPSTTMPVQSSKQIKILSQSQTHNTQTQPYEPYISIKEEPIAGSSTIANPSTKAHVQPSKQIKILKQSQYRPSPIIKLNPNIKPFKIIQYSPPAPADSSSKTTQPHSTSMP